tara:strand:+ start:82 stop:609 length:528 start_codon:yes stop_codon:yes gene_type:complete
MKEINPHRIHVTPEPVRLEGFQAIFRPGKSGKCLISLIVPASFIEPLELERPELLKSMKDELKIRRAHYRLEPWEPVRKGDYKITMRWDPEQIIHIYDSNCEAVEEEIPLYSGSLVKVSLRQSPYAMGDEVGTSLRLQAIQVIKQNGKFLEPDGFDPHGAFGLYQGGYSIHQNQT